MKYLFFLLVLGFNSCSNTEVGPKTFVIKKGQHTASDRTITTVSGDVLAFTVTFDSSAIYTLNAEDQYDINKLYGFREGVSEANSARIGWAWINNKVVLYPYVHCGGTNLGAKDPLALDSLDIGETADCSITALGNKYTFVVNGMSVDVQRCTTGGEKYLLYPYFGGNSVAPHDITIQIVNK